MGTRSLSRRPYTSRSIPRTRPSFTAGPSLMAPSTAGLEDLYVHGGLDDNVTVRFAMYSWVRNVESDWSIGDSFGMDSSFRCVLRDSYAHDTPDPNPGGAGYMLSFAEYTADSLVENNIFMNGNKVMVMRASGGGGNVIAYKLFRQWLHLVCAGLDGDRPECIPPDLSALRAVRGEPGFQYRRGRYVGRGGSSTPISATTPPASAFPIRTREIGAPLA